MIASELKKLVGWGAHPRRLALMPMLRAKAGVTEDMSRAAAGYTVRRYLEEAIGRITDSVELNEQQYQPETIRRVLRLLLQIEGSGQSAENRRYRAIVLLDAGISVEAWRRPDGPEFGLMCWFAERL